MLHFMLRCCVMLCCVWAYAAPLRVGRFCLWTQMSCPQNWSFSITYKSTTKSKSFALDDAFGCVRVHSARTLRAFCAHSARARLRLHACAFVPRAPPRAPQRLRLHLRSRLRLRLCSRAHLQSRRAALYRDSPGGRRPSRPPGGSREMPRLPRAPAPRASGARLARPRPRGGASVAM